MLINILISKSLTSNLNFKCHIIILLTFSSKISPRLTLSSFLANGLYNSIHSLEYYLVKNVLLLLIQVVIKFKNDLLFYVI